METLVIESMEDIPNSEEIFWGDWVIIASSSCPTFAEKQSDFY